MKAKKVMVIEDDATLLVAYATKLRMEGFQVTTATDGAAGLKLAIKEQPGVILLDLLMPHLSGQDFLRAYDVTGQHRNCKIVVFSNVSDPKVVDECLALGATKYLVKSAFTPNDMVEIVNELIK